MYTSNYQKKCIYTAATKKSLLVVSLILCILGSLWLLYITNIDKSYADWYDSSAQENNDNVLYNDGTLQVTSNISGQLNPLTGVTNVADSIVTTNLTNDKVIKFNTVRAVLNSGFEGYNIGTWKIYKLLTYLFSGDSTTIYNPNVELNPNESISFNVKTSLNGQDAIKLINKNPFYFRYDYDVVSQEYNYKVCIWGIEHDSINNGNNKAGLTFGPATGSSINCLNVDGHLHHSSGKRCIHEDSWEQIVANCNNGKWNLYSDCLSYGCTKSVKMDFNEAIGTKPTTPIECSGMYYNIKPEYKNFNYTYIDDDYECGDWATCRLRATLNGYDKAGSNFVPSTYAYGEGGVNDCLIRSNCLLSCFPKVLQNNIQPKYYQTATKWNVYAPYEIYSSKFVSDKLWLVSTKEIWGNPDTQFGDYGTQYAKKKLEGTTMTSYSKNLTYREDGVIKNFWTRTPSREVKTYFRIISDLYGRNRLANVKAKENLCPCFCLGVK